VADGWCWFVLREKYCWLVVGGWFVPREKYCWLVADKPSEQAVSWPPLPYTLSMAADTLSITIQLGKRKDEKERNVDRPGECR
jgi:hypothetical protein